MVYNDSFFGTQVFAYTATRAGCYFNDLGFAVFVCFQYAKWANANTDKCRTRNAFGVIDKNRLVLPHDESTIK